ncbi:hypothetical protein WNY37_05970 [Henriciella sp. AS95]|uniref:hypothetical protein n=1 Tax=Henriciella sp. AS95 TaxID=3135782 RepID=UPI003174AF16
MAETKQVFRISIGGRIGAAVIVMSIVLVAVATLAGAVQLWQASEYIWALVVASIAIPLGLILRYMLRDLQGKWGWRVEVRSDHAVVSLPSGRSLYHRPPAYSGVVAYSDLSRVECRPELYAQLGTESVIDTWWLIPKQGEALLIAEDRPTNPRYDMRTTFARETATAIAEAAGVKVKHCQMAEGHAGILGMWGVRPPGT